MFGSNHHTITVDEKRINTTAGTTHVRLFTMTDVANELNNKLYILSFQNLESVLEVADRVQFYGVPGKDNKFYADHFTYVGLKKTQLFHTNFFDQTFTTLVRNASNSAVESALETYGYSMRALVGAHLFGKLESFGYDKDNRMWRRCDEIHNQASIGEIATFRTYKTKHQQQILMRLNKKFPDGKRVSSTPRD